MIHIVGKNRSLFRRGMYMGTLFAVLSVLLIGYVVHSSLASAHSGKKDTSSSSNKGHGSSKANSHLAHMNDVRDKLKNKLGKEYDKALDTSTAQDIAK